MIAAAFMWSVLAESRLRIPSMHDLIWVGLGGLLGANARFILTRGITHRFPAWFDGSTIQPTILVNVSGSFLLASFIAWASRQAEMPEAMRAFLAIGFLGSFTTFSSFSLELIQLQLDRGWWLTLLSAILHNGVCIAAALLGWRLFAAR